MAEGSGSGGILRGRGWEAFEQALGDEGLLSGGGAGTLRDARDLAVKRKSSFAPGRVDLDIRDIEDALVDVEVGEADLAASAAFEALAGELERGRSLVKELHDSDEDRTQHLLAIAEALETRCDDMVAQWSAVAAHEGRCCAELAAAASSSHEPADVVSSANPFRFQLDNADVLEREHLRRHVMRVGCPDRGPRGRAPRPWLMLRDMPGLARGLTSVRAFKGDGAGAFDPDVPLRVVVVPRVAQRGALGEAVDCFSAHRELGLSHFFLRCHGLSARGVRASAAGVPPPAALGCSGAALLCYEHVPLHPLGPALERCGGGSDVEALVRFVCRQLLGALRDLQHQCTHIVHNASRLRLRNAFLSDTGPGFPPRLILGGLDFGPALAPGDPDAAGALAARGMALVRSLSVLVQQVVDAVSGAGDVTAQRPGGPVTVYPRSAWEPTGRLRVPLGQRFALELWADTAAGYTWEEATIAVQPIRGTAAGGSLGDSEPDAEPLPLRGLGTERAPGGDDSGGEGRAGAGGDDRVMFHLHFEATRPGRCELLLYCRQSWVPLAPEPTLTISVVVVGSTETAPVFDSAIRLCEGRGATLDGIARHRLFVTTELDRRAEREVAAELEHLTREHH